MKAAELNQLQIRPGAPPNARSVIEASIHRPRRGRIWVATYRDGSGRQFWRSTGQVDRSAAQVIAQELERVARQQRADQARSTAKQIGGVRWDTGHGRIGLTQKEVALVMRISERAVRELEKRGLRKLRHHPALRALWREWAGDIGEGTASTRDVALTDAEIAAVYGLARTREERRALNKVMARIANQASDSSF